jgi:hypothetical protein
MTPSASEWRVVCPPGCSALRFDRQAWLKRLIAAGRQACGGPEDLLSAGAEKSSDFRIERGLVDSRGALRHKRPEIWPHNWQAGVILCGKDRLCFVARRTERQATESRIEVPHQNRVPFVKNRPRTGIVRDFGAGRPPPQAGLKPDVKAIGPRHGRCCKARLVCRKRRLP